MKTIQDELFINRSYVFITVVRGIPSRISCSRVYDTFTAERKFGSMLEVSSAESNAGAFARSGKEGVAGTSGYVERDNTGWGDGF